MLHVEMVWQFLTVSDEVPDVLGSLLDVGRCLVFIRGIVQGTVFQQIILEIRGVEFTYERAVHVERGNAVFLLDIVRRVWVRYILYIVLQGAQCFALVPKREVFLLLRDNFYLVFLAAR